MGSDAPSQLSKPEVTYRTAIAVRVVLFAVQDGELRVAISHAEGRFALPSADLRGDESLDSAALRALREAPGIEHRYIEQLYSVAIEEGDHPAVVIAYLGLADAGRSSVDLHSAIWSPIATLPSISSLDSRIIAYALVRLRAKLGYTTIAFHLLPMAFSLSELQQVYEIVLDQPLDKRNFRRRIQSAGVLEATEATRREGSHRPARLFRFRAAHDSETYLTPVWANAPEGESSHP